MIAPSTTAKAGDAPNKPSPEAVERVEVLTSHVHAWGYMGPYRKGIVAGIRAAGLGEPASPPSHYGRGSLKNWRDGVEVGSERFKAAGVSPP